MAVTVKGRKPAFPTDTPPEFAVRLAMLRGRSHKDDGLFLATVALALSVVSKQRYGPPLCLGAVAMDPLPWLCCQSMGHLPPVALASAVDAYTVLSRDSGVAE